MKSKLFIAVIALLSTQLAFAEGPVAASSASGLIKKAISINLVQKKVVIDAKGAEQLVNADSVKPADIIEYHATYTNNSDKEVKSVVADLPLPDGLEYQANSAKPSRNAEQATADGKFGREPLVRKLPTGNTENIPYAEYRHVRWQLGTLVPGASVEVSARAKVETVTPKTLTPASAAAKQTSSK